MALGGLFFDSTRLPEGAVLVGVRRRPIGRSPVWAQVAGRLLRGDDVVRLRVRLQGAAAHGAMDGG